MDAESQVTRRHLIEAGGCVFALRGYRAATVREICDKAGANGASINYHFGSKEELYLEVLRQSFQDAVTHYPVDSGLGAEVRPEERLKVFISGFLRRLLSDERQSQHGRLMAWEMIDPTEALVSVVDQWIRPNAEVLRGIVRDLAGRDLGEETLSRCTMSIVSQVLFYHHCAPVVRLLYPGMLPGMGDLERVAEHIARFSVSAVRGFASTDWAAEPGGEASMSMSESEVHLL